MSETLCWMCQKSCTKGCSWSKDFVPVNGWVAEKNEKTGSYSVITCHEFVESRKLDDIDINGAHDLAASIVKVAVNDYRVAKKPATRRSIENFFRSKLFANLCDIDPEKIITLLREEVKAKASMILRDAKR